MSIVLATSQANLFGTLLARVSQHDYSTKGWNSKPESTSFVQILIEHNENIHDFCLFVCLFVVVVVVAASVLLLFCVLLSLLLLLGQLDSPVGFLLVCQTSIYIYKAPTINSVFVCFVLFLFVCCLSLLLLCVCVCVCWWWCFLHLVHVFVCLLLLSV